VPANVAKGNARETTKDYLRFLSFAVASLAEVETYLDLAIRLEFGDPDHIAKVIELTGEERRMLRGLQRSLRSKLAVPALRPPTSDL
jgi:four helix bundle protein